MTPWQVEYLHWELGVARAEALNPDAETARPAADPFASGLPPRAEFVAAWVGAGYTPDRAEAMYDELVRDWEAKNAAAERAG